MNLKMPKRTIAERIYLDFSVRLTPSTFQECHNIYKNATLFLGKDVAHTHALRKTYFSKRI
jgi:hypothetical protein